MSTSATYESQNNDALAALSSKISALRNVTVDIYDQASDRTLIDSNQDAFGGMQNNVKASMGRLTRMAQSGNKVAIFKLSGMIVGVVIFLYYVLGFFFGGGKSKPS